MRVDVTRINTRLTELCLNVAQLFCHILFKRFLFMHPFLHLGYRFSQVCAVFYLIFVSLATDGILSIEKTLNTYLIKIIFTK